ncbi:hypothetical protein A3C67_03260 [Candidatus Nomurabacteria bacterium RIFCSPHIGHO2_02_FULL_42_19]|uniref:DUF4190 domain-containing protein n=1 Tax=Candidatus Nomurabacteria bacterium RIFCSPHIGHO2_02_FULL_42_19 TaxID=1801756 RepID=A0A1F6W2P1_9BACT|nr:MAG: hypothetical protein A3C67_03260 [Candidatus Nomurabacteria bacterium RIFCSPHIGHO2_02_FULL_42_19]
MKKKLMILSGFILGAAPLVVLAQSQTTGTFVGCSGVALGTIEGMLCKIGDILNLVTPILIVLGVIYFVWGVITYVIGSDEEAKKAGRDRMIFGIIGLAVIIGLWGLVKMVTNTLGINTGVQNITYPTIPY